MSDRIQIRRADPHDAPAMAALVAQWVLVVVTQPAEAARFLRSVSLRATRKRLADDRYATHVAETDGRVVGLVVVRDRGHLYHLFVDAAMQSCGVGRRLWDAARAAARSAGHAGPYTVNASQNALPVYCALGFVATAELVHADGLTFTPMTTSPGADGAPLPR